MRCLGLSVRIGYVNGEGQWSAFPTPSDWSIMRYIIADTFNNMAVNNEIVSAIVEVDTMGNLLASSIVRDTRNGLVVKGCASHAYDMGDLLDVCGIASLAMQAVDDAVRHLPRKPYNWSARRAAVGETIADEVCATVVKAVADGLVVRQLVIDDTPCQCVLAYYAQAMA